MAAKCCNIKLAKWPKTKNFPQRHRSDTGTEGQTDSQRGYWYRYEKRLPRGGDQWPPKVAELEKLVGY